MVKPKEPKAKNKYKTKKEKEIVMEGLVIVAQTMVGEELRDEEAQSLWDYVEEVAKPTPQKSKKKKHERMRQTWAKQSPMKGLFPLLNRGREKTRWARAHLRKFPQLPRNIKGMNRLWSWLGTLTSTLFMSRVGMCIPWFSLSMDQKEEKGASRP